MSDDVEIVRGREELLDELRPLWLALRDHHHAVAPELGAIRDDEVSWTQRRGHYAQWLTEDERAFVLLARRDGRAVGYAFVTVRRQGSPTWLKDGEEAHLETLSLLPEARGLGVGARLIALVREEAERQGCADVQIAVAASNRDALRFYEREGFAPAFIVLRDTRRTP